MRATKACADRRRSSSSPTARRTRRDIAVSPHAQAALRRSLSALDGRDDGVEEEKTEVDSEEDEEREEGEEVEEDEEDEESSLPSLLSQIAELHGTRKTGNWANGAAM